MKTFVSGKKTPIIPPLLINEKLAKNFLETAKLIYLLTF